MIFRPIPGGSGAIIHRYDTYQKDFKFVQRVLEIKGPMSGSPYEVVPEDRGITEVTHALSSYRHVSHLTSQRCPLN
jgi:hypothetical protein